MDLLTAVLLIIGLGTSAFLVGFSIAAIWRTKQKSQFLNLVIGALTFGIFVFLFAFRGYCVVCNLSPIKNYLIYAGFSALTIYLIVDTAICMHRSRKEGTQ